MYPVTRSLRFPERRQGRRPLGRTLVTVLLPIVLGACAPDAWRPDSRYEAYLDQMQNRCGALRLGSRTIGNDLLQESDAYFLDVTSRYYHEEISERSYVGALSGSYDTAPDSPGILCILSLPRI